MTGTTRYESPGLGASAVLTALHSPIGRGLRHSLSELRYQARRSGRHIALPVSYSRMGDNVVIYVARADTKTWWRNFRTPRLVSLWIDGRWRIGTGHVAPVGSLEHEEVAAVYQEEHPRAELSVTDPFVVIESAAGHSPLGLHELPGTTRRHGLWRRWFASVTLGELLGFAVPAVTGVLVRDAAPVAVVTALLVAGAIEGSVLGWFQARVLRSMLPGLRTGDWVFATALGALVAWSVGVVPVASSEGIGRWSPAVFWSAVGGGGLIVLLSIGVAQWLVLRRLITGAGQWVWATAAAWLAGLFAFTAFTSPLWQEGQSAVLMVLIGVLGGLLMAAVMAAVTGTFLVRMLRAPMDSVKSEVS